MTGPSVPVARRKSSRSSNASSCVEVGIVLATYLIQVRDSKQLGSGPTLQVSGPQWSAFLAAVQTWGTALPS